MGHHRWFGQIFLHNYLLPKAEFSLSALFFHFKAAHLNVPAAVTLGIEYLCWSFM